MPARGRRCPGWSSAYSCSPPNSAPCSTSGSQPSSPSVPSSPASLPAASPSRSRVSSPTSPRWNGTRWVGTAFGLRPRWAWTLRVGLVYAYAAAVTAWVLVGYRRYRRHYRAFDWMPRDDVLARFRGHGWGLFGLLVVWLFLVAAVFAPALGPTTVERDIADPYSHELTYWDAEADAVATVPVGDANLASQSRGDPTETVGLWSSDDFGRFHPLGTTAGGEDLATHLVHGARVSLSIGIAAMLGAGLLALAFALVSAYYRGLADLLLVLVGDTVQSIPLLLLLLLVLAVFRGTPVYEFYDALPLLSAVLALAQWPFLWRAVRAPALRVGEAGWVDAARAFGQRPSTTMRKHIAPHVVGYLFVYASLSLGGVILAVAALSFLGLGVPSPTPEWGRLVAEGRSHVVGPAWHVALVPGLAITLVVTGFNALGDGVRDAIDPESAGGDAAESGVGGAGG